MKKTLFLSILLMLGFHSRAQINILSIDSIVQKAIINESFEGTVLVAGSGKVVYQKSIGFKDQTKIDPIVNSSHFAIASITKMLTAIVILQLVEEGKFKLSDNLKNLLPSYEIENSDSITIHHLLLHISGLPNENDQIYTEHYVPEEFVQKTLSNNYNSLGEFNYANIDYVLLGIIIEKYDKKPWSESVQARILDQAEMTQTGFLEKDKYPKDFARSFSFDQENMRQSDPQLFIENYYAAGCMYSTALDLLKLDQLMYSNEFLSEKSKELMYTSYPEYNYSGYSVWTYNYPFAETTPRIMERRGGILGANSVLIRMLDTNKTIIILSNNNKFNPDSFGNTESLKEALIIALGKAKP